MNERRVHVYARGRGLVVVPVCRQLEGAWAECQPVQQIPLTKGRATSVYLGRAIDDASAHPCTDIQLWDGAGGWREHHLVAACVIWESDRVRLVRLPDKDLLGEWPASASSEPIAYQIIAEMGRVLA